MIIMKSFSLSFFLQTIYEIEVMNDSEMAQTFLSTHFSLISGDKLPHMILKSLVSLPFLSFTLDLNCGSDTVLYYIYTPLKHYIL